MNKKIFMIAMLVFISLASINLIQSKVFIDQPQVIVQVFSGTETTYLALTDTENTYVGQAGLCVIVNTSEGGLTFGACGSGAGDVVNGSQGYVLNFTNIFSDDWTNVTITQSQISDFSPITDTNETLRFENLTDVSCSGNDKVIGVFPNGTVQCGSDVSGSGGKGTSSDYLFNDSSDIFFNDTFQNNTLDTRYIRNDTEGWTLNISRLFPEIFYTLANSFRWNMYDDGSNMFLNVSNGGGDFSIEQENTKLILFNTPNAANDFKVFQVFSKQASDVSEFVITKAGVGHASFAIRSFSLPGNATNTPTPFNCSTYANFIDCATDITGADLYVEDDIESLGSVFFGNGTINSTDEGNFSALFYFGDGSNLINLPSAALTNPFDQELNITSNVTFDQIFARNWTNVTILESQVTDLTHTTDTNETLRFENLTDVSCAGNDKVIGVFANGTIQCATDVTGAGGKGTSSDYLFNDSANIFFNDSFQNNTLDTRYIQNEAIGIILNFTNIFSLDWSNISGLTQSQFENSTFHYNQTVLDTNETVRFENLTDVSCAGNDKVVGVFANGTIQCATDQDSGAALTNPFDQELNITSNVTFNAVNSTNWLNVSITESQISNLQTYTINDTLDWVLNFSSIFSKDWSNISDLIDAQINDDLTISGGIIGSNSISGTLTTTGTLTIGDGGDQIDIDSDSWDVTNGVVTGASIVASQITTGTFGTGNYVMDTNLTVQDLVMEANLSQRISSNVTCMILYGVTTTLELC